MNVQIETDLKEILTRIDNNLNKLSTDITELKVGQAEIKGDVKKLDTDISTIKEDIKEIKGAQKTLTTDVADLKGSKSLIVPIMVAITASILTLVIRAIPIS